MMLAALIPALISFTATFVGLRVIEWGYHRWRHTPDWSPHWGSWLFAVLVGVFFFIEYLGR